MFSSDNTPASRGFSSGTGDSAPIFNLSQHIRTASWDIALQCVDISLREHDHSAVDTVRRLSNLPAFIGALATTLTRPRSSQRPGSAATSRTNPVLTRIARDHVVQRESLGFSAREIVHEFLLLRRVLWLYIQQFASQLDTKTVLELENRLNSVLDEVIVECTVVYFDRATHALSEQGRRDSLTGLLNHQAFHNRLDTEIDRCRRYGHALQIIYFDLDDFKQINDTHGHPEGDSVLQIISLLVSDSIRDSDFAGRVGGDEFVICLVESSELAAHLLLDRLRARLARRVAEGAVPEGAGLSAGCASFPKEADSAQDLLVLADRRLYDDKRLRKSH